MAVQTMTASEETTLDFKGDVNVNDRPPSQKDLDKAADLTVLDTKSQPHAFKSLYNRQTGPRRTLIIFIRHFFCGNCQEYLRSLSTSVTPEVLQSLPTPTEIIVIGCGQPELIPMYTKETACPYPIYADPSKKLYNILGMTRTLSLGNKSPEYMQYSVPSAIIRAIYQGLRAGRDALKGGDYFQVGGEFLFDDGEVTWCHRMQNTRDHSEIPAMRKIIGLDGAKPPARKTFSSGIRRSSSQLGRRLSDKRKSWSRSRDRTGKTSPEGSMMENLKEDQGAEEAEGKVADSAATVASSRPS